MTVFSKIRSFLYRHRNKFFVSGVIITGSILLTRYAQQRLREWQERETKEIIERTRREQHFESIQRTCNETILNVGLALKNSLAHLLDTESIVDQLRNNPEDKVKLWETLKVMVFTRAGCLIYLLTMLVITLRIQLNIIGGYLYKDSACLSSEMQKKYLSFCNTLLDSGASKAFNIIKCEFQKILDPISLKKPLKLKDLESIFWAFQTTIATSHNNPIENFKEYIIPEEVQNGNEFFRSIVQDTADLIESEEIQSLANHCIHRSFVLLSDSIAEYYVPDQPAEDAGNRRSFIHPSDIGIAMAKLIPIVNGLVSKNAFPDRLMQELLTNTKVKTLGANIYECFSNTK